ncbi:hypothetical protein Lal_00016754 [Lupinus albus]|nr:hypothetical protein Lal_00016754 [Lupinus albus]
MENLHLRQNPQVDEGFSLKRETCRSSDVEAVATTKGVRLSLKRDPSRSSEIQGQFWGLSQVNFGALVSLCIKHGYDTVTH